MSVCIWVALGCSWTFTSVAIWKWQTEGFSVTSCPSVISSCMLPHLIHSHKLGFTKPLGLPNQFLINDRYSFSSVSDQLLNSYSKEKINYHWYICNVTFVFNLEQEWTNPWRFKIVLISSIQTSYSLYIFRELCFNVLVDIVWNLLC